MRHPVLTLRAKEGQPPNRYPDVWSGPRAQTKRSSTCLRQEFAAGSRFPLREKPDPCLRVL
jgi:hypothetical protein